MIASAEFAAQLPEHFTTVGEFSMAGFAATQTVFGLSDETIVGQQDRRAQRADKTVHASRELHTAPKTTTCMVWARHDEYVGRAGDPAAAKSSS